MVFYLIITFLLFLLIFLNYHNIAILLNIYDFPNHRKIHKKKVPLLGGVIFFICFFLISIFSDYFQNHISDIFSFSKKIDYIFFYLIFFLVFILGFIDDKINISGLFRTIVLIFLSAILFYISDDFAIKSIKFKNYEIDFFQYSTIISIFLFILFINMTNMFDGVNLQSSSLFFASWLYIFFNSGYLPIVLFVFIFLFFFIFFNFNSRIFMGDNGIYTLGFITFIFLSLSWNKNPNSFEEITCLFLLPFVDLVRVFFVRLLNNKSPFSPDKKHIHHLLLKKYSFLTVIIIINLFLYIPIVSLTVFGLNYFFVILSSLIIYILLINNKLLKK